MKKRNPYYLVGIIGMGLNLILYFVVFFVADPYLAAAFSVFFPVWIIILVVGYRKEHPRK